MGKRVLIAGIAMLAVGAAACESKFLGGLGDGWSGGNSDGEACQLGNQRCQSGMIYVCKQGSSGLPTWQQHKVCTTHQTCKHVGGVATCVDIASCNDGKKNQDETDTDCGGASCGKCADGKQCKKDDDCMNKACSGGVCKPCKAGQASCLGNFLRECAPDGSGWNTIKTCNPSSYEKCDPVKKVCEVLKAQGSPTPTGKYYLYSQFHRDSTTFRGGYDVDGYGDLLYVNNSRKLDVYKIELVDTDGDGKMEPDQHPEYKKNQGPIEARKLTYIKTYPGVTLGQPSVGEIFAEKDRIYFVKVEGSGSNIYEYIFATGQVNKVVSSKIRLSCIGYDSVRKQWYGAYNSSKRVVYNYWPNGGGFAAQFWYPDLAGSHLDGIEVVLDPNYKSTAEPGWKRTYVYVSDMTSDFLAQYYFDEKTKLWVQANVFEYKETQNQYVEGMGFGAFNHFWMTSGKMLYEVGGGDLQKYVKPPIK